MPPWFIVSTAVVFVASSVATRALYRRSEAHQVGLLSKQQFTNLRLLAWRVINGLVIVAWYVTVSMFLISDSASDIRRLIDGDDLGRCLFLNGAEEVNRRASFEDIAAVSRNLRAIGVDQEAVDGLAADRLAAIPPVEETDRDCDGSGIIGDAGDYPPND